jgi:gas vesicle protein
MSIRQTSDKPGLIGVWLGVVIGATIAGVVTLLLNPQSGHDNRATIRDRALRAREAIIWHARAEAQSVEEKNHKKKNQ